MEMEFTGERLVPGKVHGDLWAEHVSRYLFAEPIVAGRRVLDLGTGAGYGARVLARSAREVVALDVASDAVRYAREEFGAENVHHVVADAVVLPFASGSFEAVVSFELLEHVREQESLLNEVRRVLAPGGRFVVSTPNRLYYTDERHETNAFHVRELDPEEFESLLRDVFPHVAVYQQNHAPSVVIDSYADDGAAGVHRDAGAAAAPCTSHYLVAVCGEEPVDVRPMVFFPAGTGNVLREREIHLHAVMAELEGAREKARSMGEELQATTAQLRRVEANLLLANADFAKATAWQRSAVVRALRSALPVVAATGAIPLAAVVGAGALAADAIARVRPRRFEPVQPPRDPTLATLLVLNYNGKDLLERNAPHLLAAIERSGRPHQLLVVDNGSTDGSSEFLRGLRGVDVVELPRNYFFSGGNNRGIPHARHDIVVLLNTDMRVEPDFLDPLLAPFQADPDVFCVASQILMAGPRQEETGLTRGRFENGRISLRHDPVPDDARELIPILWGGGGACAFDKHKYLALGGLDELYDPFYCEDADLSLRAWARGWTAYLQPTSRVWHEHRTTSRRVFGEKFVNETVRRNLLLLHWVNIRDPRVLAEHVRSLPRMAWAQARDHGLSGVRSFARAACLVPAALARRARRPAGISVAEILSSTDAGVVPGVRPRRPQASASRPLRITMVTPYHLWPVQHGGAVRMYHVARELARRGHELSVVGFVDTEEQVAAGRHLEEFCREVKLLVRRPPSGLRAFGIPSEVAAFDQVHLRRALHEHLEQTDPDVLHVEYTHMAPYAMRSPRRITCLTEHDVAFVSAYRHALVERGFSRALAYARYLELFRYELAALRRFDLVFTVTEHDAALLRSYAPAVAVSGRAPIGADVSELARIVRCPDRATLLFVGNYAHRPNVDAVRYLAREILPEVHRREPEARLIIAGPHAPADVRRLAEDSRISVPGFVEDLASLYSKATLVVAPIRLAAGVRVKLLEAFAARVPVVSTAPGTEGLDVAHGREILIGDRPATFADEVVRIIRDPALGRRVANAAFALAEERYAWPSIAAALEAEYRETLNRKNL
jgi:O-antigen biosynthesis protein